MSEVELFGDFYAGTDRLAPTADDIDELARATTLCGQDFVLKVKKHFADRQILLTKAVKTDDEEAKREGECPLCFDLDLTDERVCAPCGHSYCGTCLENLFTSAVGGVSELSDEQTQRGVRTCPLCRSHIEQTKIFRASAFEEHPDVKDEIQELSNPLEVKTGKRRVVSDKSIDSDCVLMM